MLACVCKVTCMSCLVLRILPCSSSAMWYCSVKDKPQPAWLFASRLLDSQFLLYSFKSLWWAFESLRWTNWTWRWLWWFTGNYELKIQTWRPTGYRIVDMLQQFFVGGAPEMTDITFVSQPNDFEVCLYLPAQKNCHAVNIMLTSNHTSSCGFREWTFSGSYGVNDNDSANCMSSICWLRKF